MSRADIKQKLRNHNVQPTVQRLDVAEVLLQKPQHLSADQIIDVLRRNGSRISKATVYNSLNIFSKNGLIKEISVASGRKYYDSTTHAHHHFYHVETGELIDIPLEKVGIMTIPRLPRGTEQEGVEVVIRVRTKRV
ncbi:MAG: Fur family transcriptional regulator [Proteobacteria bacterium]|nr:Fur family transcriptional regulator [Pseudomonadota bacterium]MDA0994572.1 Fur family transcriptional regulator [Pseudomonadota bacterium]